MTTDSPMMPSNLKATTSGNHSRGPLFPIASGHMPLWILITAFFIGLWLTSLLLMAIGSDTRTRLLSGAIVQDALSFIMPTLLTGWLITRKPLLWSGMKTTASPLVLFGTAGVFFVGIAFLNYTVALNEALTLPPWLDGLERLMRSLEQQAANTTDLMLSDDSIGGLISSILVIGIIGPLAEEIFFRGGLQRTLYGPNPWKAVWWTALIFSLMHFQMYGFLPRFLLGLWFGYLYLWSGSLWPCVLAHALNNSATVICTWMVHRGMLDETLVAIGADGTTWTVCSSIILSAICITRVRIIAKSLKYGR